MRLPSSIRLKSTEKKTHARQLVRLAKPQLMDALFQRRMPTCPFNLLFCNCSGRESYIIFRKKAPHENEASQSPETEAIGHYLLFSFTR
jgi:hypothetical protein